MQFAPMTRQEILDLSNNLLQPGTCSFVIKNAVEEYAKSSGDLQMKVELEVTDSNMKKITISDFIFYSEKAKWKIVSFCRAINEEEKLIAGMVETRDVINKRGQLIIKHEEWNGEKRNKVVKYIPFLDQAMEQIAKSEKPFFDDEIAF